MKLRRRHFLALGAASTGGIIFSRWMMGKSQSSPPVISPKTTASKAITIPKVYQSQNGLLAVDITAGKSLIQVGNQQAHLLSYNGQIPAPRLEVKPGDTVRINFTNKLSEATNLHYHGLHISPSGKGDNVFLNIPPNERLTYQFTIPQNHRAGTFWYHPHHHGHVADQVFAGLAGLFIVRGQLDEIPEVKAAQEQFIILKDFDFDGNGEINPPSHIDLMMGREGSLITVNGQINPTLLIASGGLLRLRILNASVSRFYQLSLENHPFYLIATDGGAITKPVELSNILLAPGERVEVLVKGDQEPKQYKLLNLPYDRGGMGMMNHGMMSHGGMGGMMNGNDRESTEAQSPQLLATLKYQGTTPALSLPPKLIDVESLPKPTNTRRIELSMTMGMGGMAFLFNGKTFDMERIDANVKLGTVEDWELVNIDPDLMDHPFHLHVNAFQVISRNGKPEPYRAWKDTVVVKGGEKVVIRIPFQDFTGKSVYHCHILDHEDLGMMGNLEITA